MRIFITGATGFVGRHLAAELLHSGHEIFLSDRIGGTEEITKIGRLEVLKMDVTNFTECQSVLAEIKPDAVIHLAGISQTTGILSQDLETINVRGSENVARAFSVARPNSIKHPRAFLYVSSAFVYSGKFNEGIYYCSPDTPVSPRGAYGESKLAAENIVRKFQQTGLEIYIVRPFNHIGPGQDVSFVVPALASRMREASTSSAIETGSLSSTRDFTDVRDVVRAYRLILEKSPIEKVFVIGSGTATPIQKAFDLLNELSGKVLRHKSADHLKREEDNATLLADYSLAKRVLGWSPKIPFNQSIKDVWHEFK